jgi:hypothetical protein
MTFNELALMVSDLLELLANYSRDPTQENWELIIDQAIQIDSKMQMSYPQERETKNGRPIQ